MPESAKLKCPSCKEEIKKEDLMKCADCGKLGCANCFESDYCVDCEDLRAKELAAEKDEEDEEDEDEEGDDWDDLEEDSEDGGGDDDDEWEDEEEDTMDEF